jgi:hypothetical protein
MIDRAPRVTSRPSWRSAVGAVVAAAAFVLVVAACGGSAGAPAPGSASLPASPTTPAPTPPAGGSPISEAEAIARVLAQDPGFAGITPLDPDLIGQAAWYEVSPGVVGWRVTITKGWGDCQAGCISRHTWVYEVDGTGNVRLVEERGDAPEGGTGLGPGGGAGDGEPSPPIAVPADGGPWIAGLAYAGPVCPVARVPPDPSCADRPVAGAAVVIRDGDGRAVARSTTAADGTFLAAVPAGGGYVVEAGPVEGLLGTPAAQAVIVPDGPGASVVVNLAYDTGIR